MKLGRTFDAAIDASWGALAGRTIRVGVTGLARAGKTAFLTSVAANLLAFGAGRPVLPALARRLRGRTMQATLAPARASALPRFDHQAHMAALAVDPPRWPARTDAASMLALDLVLSRQAFGAALPPQRVRLELLDYPGEWLLDLPLLRTSFGAWSDQVLRRLEGQGLAQEFLGFALGLPAKAPADEALAATGHRLYRAMLRRLRDEAGLSFLQPGRFLMPAPGPEPGWMPFFPMRGSGGLQTLLAQRYDAYAQAVARDISDPLFGRVDRLVVLVDLLSALHVGPVPFADAAGALAAAAQALRWRRTLLETAVALVQLRRPPPTVSHVVFAATKADHVAERQRGNLAALLRDVAAPALPDVRAAFLAVASVRCTEDVVLSLDGHPVSAVRGRRIGDAVAGRSYPGEVPDHRPDLAFWAHPFLQLPDFEPLRLPDGGRGGVPNVGLDALLATLLDDVL